MLRVCRSFMLLLLLVHLSTCVYIRLIKTVTFHDISESEKERILLFLTVNMDGDGPRDLRSACSFCPVYISDKKWESDALSASITINWFWSGEVWLYGKLSLCCGDKDTFRQFPATLSSKSSWNCKQLIYTTMAPERAAMEPLVLGIFTWFMSREHYDDLRLRGSTELLAPLSPDEPYDLPVYFMLFHEASREDGVHCTLHRPYVVNPTPLTIAEESDHVWHYTRQLTKLMFKVKSLPEKSGTYTVRCEAKYYYQPDGLWLPLHVEKDITIRFEKVPKIELAGIPENTVFFPHSNETGEFYVHIYSTSDIVSVHISRSDGIRNKATAEILIKFISHEYYQLQAKYRVTLPWLENSLTGRYTIRASNEQDQSAKLDIRLHMVEEMVVMVNPAKMEVEEESTVSFHCLVLTDLPANTTVTWINTPQQQKEGLIESKELSITGNRRAIELTIQSATLSQTGVYSCVADNGFQRVERTVTLVVHPPGVVNYKAEHKATWMEKMSCDQVLDVGTVNLMKTAAKVGLVLLLIVLVLVAAAVSGLVGWKVYQKIQQRRQSRSGSECNTDSETQPLLGPSTEEKEGGEKTEDEVEGELAELLQGMETSEIHTPSPQGKTKGKTPAVKKKDKDSRTTTGERTTGVRGDEDEEPSHKTKKKKQKLTTGDGGSERDGPVKNKKGDKVSYTVDAGGRNEKKKRRSDTGDNGSKDEKRKGPTDTGDSGSKDARKKRPSDTGDSGSKDARRERPTDTGDKDKSKSRDATQKSATTTTDTEPRTGRSSATKNKRQK